MSVFTPDGTKNCLVDDLNLELQDDTNMLINGPSSSGKTSLMRVIGHLWPRKSGTCIVDDKTYYMPQNSYMCVDDVTLRQGILNRLDWK